MNEFELSWTRAWKGLGQVPPQGVHEQLMQAYGETHRHYHALQHLEECLMHFSAARHLAQHPEEVELALWFHDAIYDLQAKDNELRSAQWAVATLAQAHVPKDVQARVHALIMSTRHEAVPSDADQQLLVDIDLAILGAAPERFAQYDEQVACEYSWVPRLIYGMKRKAVLKGFLARPHLYSTGHFRERLEAQARANLSRAVA